MSFIPVATVKAVNDLDYGPRVLPTLDMVSEIAGVNILKAVEIIFNPKPVS